MNKRFGRRFWNRGGGSPPQLIERPGYTIWISGGTCDHRGEGVCVEVRFRGGGAWGATLYTPECVRAILDEWRRVVGGNSGLYFWAPGVISIRELAPSERIVALVEDLLSEDELELAFAPLEHDRHVP